jgi:hypothetical protein
VRRSRGVVVRARARRSVAFRARLVEAVRMSERVHGDAVDAAQRAAPRLAITLAWFAVGATFAGCVASPDAARDAVVEARRAGARDGAATTENGCVRAAVDRIGVCGQLAFECQTQALAYAEACFGAARPSVRACRELPPIRPDEDASTHRARLTRHAGSVCRDLGRASVQACTQVLVVLEQHCVSAARAARVRTATVATTTTATDAR